MACPQSMAITISRISNNMQYTTETQWCQELSIWLLKRDAAFTLAPTQFVDSAS